MKAARATNQILEDWGDEGGGTAAAPVVAEPGGKSAARRHEPDDIPSPGPSGVARAVVSRQRVFGDSCRKA